MRSTLHTTRHNGHSFKPAADYCKTEWTPEHDVDLGASVAVHGVADVAAQPNFRVHVYLLPTIRTAVAGAYPSARPRSL